MNGELWLLEDSDEDADMFEFAATATGLPARIRRFANGEEFLRAGSSCEAGGEPALTVVDLNLPGVDGRKLLEKVKAVPAFAPVPLVVLSSSANPGDIRNSYAGGACGYLVKPLGLDRYEELLKSIRDFWFGAAFRFPAPAPGAAAVNGRAARLDP